jgi:uncharacterized protein (TIGR00288 family)
MFRFVKRMFDKGVDSRNIAVFIDGPNILRKDLGVSLADIKKNLEKFGKVKIGRVFMNQYASEKLVEAVVNHGFESVITVGDVDVSMVADAVEAIFNPQIHTIVFVTRDSDFLPAIIKAKREGKETVVMLTEEASSVSLKNNADHVILLGK